MSKRWLGLLLLVAVWIGGGGVARATVTASPTSIAIGNVAVGASGPGSTSLSASPNVSVTLELGTTADCPQFQILTGSPLSLNSSNKMVSVQLTPTSKGAKSCDVIVKDSITSTELLRFAVTGTGIAPAITVSPSSFDFGGVRFASGTATKQFTISNTGDAGTTLSVTGITFSGTNSTDYNLNPSVTFPLTVSVGTPKTVTVVFDPSVAGPSMASMDIASNDPANATKSVTLTGTGTNGTIAVTDVNFNTVDDGTTANQTVTISNSATTFPGLLTVTSAAITGGNFFSFGTTQGCSGGTNCTFSPALTVSTGTVTAPVRCQPPVGATGTQTATITFSSDSDPGGTTTAQLSCTAGRSMITVSTNTLAFGNVPVNTASTPQTVTITNNGNGTLTYSLSKTPNVAQYAISGCISGCTVVAGGTATFSVTFSPTVSGTLTTRIDITNNDPNNGVVSINVSSTGTAPQISVAPGGPLTFANTEVGQTSATQTVVATNTGNAPLTISNATFATGAADYTASVVTLPQTLAPMTSLSWNLACKPSTLGSRAGKFRFTSDSETGTTTDVSLSCTGDQGIVATNPTSLNFGGVTQGSTKSLTFSLQNIGNVAISGITAVLDKTTIGYQFDTTTVPTTLAGGATKTLTVTFAPQSGNDGGPATITFTANWGTHGATTTAVLTLDGDGLAAGYDITPGTTFDFGSFRFDARPQVVYHIVNTGQINVAIQTQVFTPDAGTTVGEIGIAISKAGTPKVLPQTLLPNEQLDITLTAQPNNRVGLVSGHIDIHSDLTNLPPDRRVTLTGNATTAALSVPASVDFGPVDVDGPPLTKTFTLTNSGAATLDVSSIAKMAGASPAFTVTLPSSVTHVAPGDNLSLTITYKPTVERPANQFDTLVLVANLAGIFGGPAQAMITVQGRGIDRHIALDAVNPFPLAVLGPGNEGSTQAITVHNTGEATLSITALMFGGDPVWQLVDPSPVDIAGNSSHDFQVKFVPTAVGSFSGDLVLMNNDNGQRMAMVTLTGSAVFVDAHGGGGCNAGSTSAGGGAGLMLGALVFVALGRRRRDSRRRAGHAATAIALTVIGGVLASAPATRADSIGITVFEPTPTTAGGGFQLQSPDVGPDGSWAVNTTFSYASNPLVLDIDNGNSVSHDAAIRHSSLLQVGAAYAFLGRFEAGANLPLYMQNGNSDPTMVTLLGKPVSGTATGDLALHAKARLWRGGGSFASLLAGTSLTVTVPTATKDQFTGSDKPAARLLLLGSLTPAALRSRLTISANAGAILRAKSIYGNIAQQSGAAWGASAQYRVLDKLWASAEVFGEATPSGRQQQVMGAIPQTVTLSPIEWLAGANYQVDPRFIVGLAVGRGLTDALGTPDLRGVLSISLVSGGAALAPIHPAEPAGPDGDADGDGIPDSVDKCPNEPEDKDMFEDSDGCPDPDNDHDGIPDDKDKCPLDPEDKDGFQDADGCPDPDNDHDGIPDKLDKCPNDPEDKDGFEDLDGCPDPDNDHDGIPDVKDKCPNEPETINGFQDDDGCPDKGETAIILSPDRIETLDPIQFSGLKLTRASTPLIEQVGATLRAHAEIVRLRVTVHVQPTNDQDADQAKSDKRAQAVRDWLIQFGIAPARLEARGFGGEKPLVSPDKRGAAKINDRIEFIILERK